MLRQNTVGRGDIVVFPDGTGVGERSWTVGARSPYGDLAWGTNPGFGARGAVSVRAPPGGAQRIETIVPPSLLPGEGVQQESTLKRSAPMRATAPPAAARPFPRTRRAPPRRPPAPDPQAPRPTSTTRC